MLSYIRIQTVAFSCALLFAGAQSVLKAQTPDVAQSGGVTILRGGGARGEVKNSAPGLFEIKPTLGGRLVVKSEEVKQTTVLRPEQIDYRNFAPLQPDVPEAHLKIARWASERKLSALADEQYRRVVELDPDNEEARKALQHVKENGVWVSKKEQMEQRGLERVGGRNVSKQEAEIYRQREQEKDDARYWKKQVETLYQRALNGDAQAKDALRRLKNPLALPSLLAAYKAEKRNPEGRILIIQAIASIGTPTALGSLGAVALEDPDPDARVVAIDGIARKTIARDDAIEFFIRKTRSSDDPDVIERAAFALGKLQAERAIPVLINALVTAHKRQIVVGSQQTGMSVDSTGAISGFSPGGGGKVKTVIETRQNEGVRDALVAIVAANYQSPVDFGFDVDAWIRWRREVDQLGAFYPRRDR